MPQTTLKLGMTTYDLVNDGSVYFSTFRTTLAGYTNSALTKIDDFATQISTDVNLLKSNPPIVRISAIKTDDFSYAVTGITEVTAYNNGMYINLSLDNTNIGTVSLNINNLGAKGVYKIGADGLVANISAGDLRKNKMNLFRYNGTSWVWVNAITSDQLNIIGTVGNLTKISTSNTLEDSGVTFATTATNNTIAQRTPTGQVKVANPVATEDATNKGYADNIDGKIGVLSNLTTTNKTNIVNALNEVDGKNYMYGDPVSVFDNFDPINAQFLEGNPASYFSTKAYADTKAPINSPTFTGVPSSVTPAVNDNTTKIATTAFVNAEISNDRPYATTTTSLTNGGTGVAGTSSSVARADHTHTMPQSVLQSQVVNDLTTGGETSVLSAQQGVALKGFVDAKIPTSAIINDLTTGGATNVLSAEQGVELTSAIGQKFDKSTIKINVNCNTLLAGFYIIKNSDLSISGNTALNYPSEPGTWALMVLPSLFNNTSNGLWFLCQNRDSGCIYTKHEVGGIYSTWKEVATTEKYTMQASDMRNGWALRHGNTLQKIGNRVFVRFEIHSGVANVDTVVCNIPAGFRSVTDKAFIARAYATTNENPVNQFMTVWPDGNVQIKYTSSKPLIFIEASWEV